MAGIGKEYGFTLNFDIPWPFTHRKTELPHKMVNSESDCRTASCIPEKRYSNELTLGTRLGVLAGVILRNQKSQATRAQVQYKPSFKRHDTGSRT